MSPDYLPFHPQPSRPDFQAPRGAVDAHCHVFGPAAEFPFAPERKYTPCDAGKDQLFALRDHMGFSRNVIVQASCHGADNSALVDALRHAGDLARGVAVVRPDITDAELNDLHAAGVRAVRFNFVKRLVDSTPWSDCLAITERVRRLGWHVVIYFEAPDLAELTPLIQQLNTTVVIDHMGRPDVTAGVEHPDFRRFVELLEHNPRLWTKVSCPERLTVQGPPYEDVVPFARSLVAHFPDRVLWGTDWPHPNMKSHMPDDGALVDLIPLIAPTAELQRQLLVDNPMRLYWS
ncbi:2-pyrone-4,6-dicarboxylate hydrolase [Natronospirillum operosum]|uniref:2-pyrone-4,6-dicarboxylate hydrolase n=1 Tax=Natronospirillum operosum TaxID=2759953 RepID=A0A4Z0W6I2_9GAMM|nr:amidohydrolase family protein [Natronospirillum operosum]TGG93404.1 2-pyrone-4,6-dicarboxylate hydrolase [Natronospirillum operosum]